jgi:periplasmic protein CpxP/Spy
MKKLFLITSLILAACCVNGLYAQQKDMSTRMAEMKQKMKTDLKLTDAQADSISSIQQFYMPQRREIYQDQSLSQDDKQAKLKDIGDQADKRIKAVLGDPLFGQYKDWWQKNRPQRMGGPSTN